MQPWKQRCSADRNRALHGVLRFATYTIRTRPCENIKPAACAFIMSPFGVIVGCRVPRQPQQSSWTKLVGSVSHTVIRSRLRVCICIEHQLSGLEILAGLSYVFTCVQQSSGPSRSVSRSLAASESGLHVIDATHLAVSAH